MNTMRMIIAPFMSSVSVPFPIERKHLGSMNDLLSARVRAARDASLKNQPSLRSFPSIEAKLTAAEKRFAQIKQQKDSSHYQVLEVMNRLAIMIGELEKVQDTKIDAVQTVELVSGKEVARNSRKDLNRRAVALQKRSRDLYSECSRIVEKSPV